MRPSVKFKVALILGLLIIFFAVLNLTSLNKDIKNFFYLTSQPFEKFIWQMGDRFSDFFSGIFKAKNLAREAEELRLENQKLLSQITNLIEIKKENETLREALNLGLEKDFQLIFAQIISKDPSRDSILINKGLKDGLSKGLPVITSQRVIMGRVGEIYDDFSEVILISNKESSFDAKIAKAFLEPAETSSSEKEIYGVVKGMGGFKIYFDLIPKEEKISKGDLIVTAALGGIFPPGLLVGTVKEIKNSDVEPWQRIDIEPYFDIKNLDKIFIITD